ncbi:head GIN domain-containing protein [Pontibacter indicus]|uniref:Putative auto-transporter adhesin, head GIN domain n=1 Tax=Pontibacter indicus TaxID=1317125 RepID=A0A1R3XF44_9BACT|nr:head GIN domain-containing protein [Pontibacter indicus]SIT89416.1 Putative auto-transporter adhesin, head GIN domain [Pontibacter indicus]
MNIINIYKAVVALLVTFFVLTSLTTLAQERRNLKGEGEPVSQNRKMSGFKGIDVSGGFAVELTQSGSEGVRIEAQENLLGSIKTEVKNGVLHIYTSDNISTNKGLKAYVSIKELNAIDISGGVKVKGNSTFKSDAFKMDLSGGSNITLALNTKKLTANMSGASKVLLSGRADEVRMDMSGASKVDAVELEAKNVHVEASGASNVKVFAKNQLNVNASGATKVAYKGDPSVTSSVSAAAKISKM